MPERFYLSLANEMSAKLRRVGTFTNHAPSIGAYHEEVLKAVLRSMLPDRFSVKTGFAFSPNLGTSQQGDILIIDENHPAAYHFREGEFAVALPEAVVCVIEVKTKLTKRTFQEAMTSLHSFRKVSTSKHPVSYLFAYESQPFNDATLSSWCNSINAVPDKLQNYPWAIYALNQGMVVLQYESKSNKYGLSPFEGETNRGPKLRSLSMFLQTVRKSILLYAGLSNNPFEFAVSDGLRLSTIGYRFGTDEPDD